MDKDNTSQSADRSNGSIEKIGDLENTSTDHLKSADGIVLVPQPTDDPRDPLNWPQWKKELNFYVITLATFASTVGPLAGQLNLSAQAKLYHKTPTEEAYANSAAVAGIAAGPYLMPFFILRMGRCSVIAWSLVALFFTQVWAALMTDHGDYIGYIMSRLVSGIFASVVGVVGSQIFVDLFFLHERGRRFAINFTTNVFGSVVGPTVSGFISGSTSWPAEYWWSAGLVGLAFVCCFLFLEETGYERPCTGGTKSKKWPVVDKSSWLRNRFQTFVVGQAVQPKYTIGDTVAACVNPFLVLFTPVSLLAGLFGLIIFGVYIGTNSLAPVFLQRPIKKGGYAFTVTQNAEFSFNHWVGILVVLIYTFSLSDRIPLYICRRRGCIWKPEYRLYSLIGPGIITPIGCGIWGAGFQYRLHYMVLAFGSFLVTIGAFAPVPILANYLVECFIDYPVEGAMSSHFWRLVWGLSVPFYIQEWVGEVGLGWVYGTMAFMSLASCGAIVVLMIWGDQVRKLGFKRLDTSEAGTKILM